MQSGDRGEPEERSVTSRTIAHGSTGHLNALYDYHPMTETVSAVNKVRYLVHFISTNLNDYYSHVRFRRSRVTY